jgi:cysteinyl-tRNA synthetase
VEAAKICEDAKKAFSSAVGDDLNIAGAIAVIHNLVKEANKLLDLGRIGFQESKKILDTFKDFDKILAVFDVDEALLSSAPDFVMELLNKRQSAKIAKDFALADKIRNEIHSAGWLVEDTPQGPRVVPKM